MPPDVCITVKHYTGALVCHAKFMRVYRHARHPRHRKVEGGYLVAQLPGERQDKAAKTGIGVEHDFVLKG